MKANFLRSLVLGMVFSLPVPDVQGQPLTCKQVLQGKVPHSPDARGEQLCSTAYITCVANVLLVEKIKALKNALATTQDSRRKKDLEKDLKRFQDGLTIGRATEEYFLTACEATQQLENHQVLQGIVTGDIKP